MLTAGVWPDCRLVTTPLYWARQSAVVGRQHSSRIGFSVAADINSGWFLLACLESVQTVVLCRFWLQCSHGLGRRRLSMYVSLFTAAIPANHTSELFCTWHQRFPGIFLKLCMLVFLLFIFLHRTRPCDRTIPRIRSHTKCSHYTVGGSRTYCSQDWFSIKALLK